MAVGAGFRARMIRLNQPLGRLSNGGDIHPLLHRIYRNRGINDSLELNYELDALPDPDDLPGLQQAVQCLLGHLQKGSHILVAGDFDADGATGCAVCVRGLRLLGCESGKIDYVVPDRRRHGYGLSPELVAEIAVQKPELLITVDNGISSVAGVAAANAAGMQVIVTDHHLPPQQLPEAEAIVNPKLLKNGFGGANLAGVGVMYFLMLGLRRALRKDGYFTRRNISEPAMHSLLDFVAIGTVADMVEMDHCNRILVAQGLTIMRSGNAHAGIQSLLASAGKNPVHLQANDLAFDIAPRLNAAGRLEDMSTGIECLLTDTPAVANEFSAELNRINSDRRSLQRQMQDTADQLVDDLAQRLTSLPAGLCLYDSSWHQGVVGLVAGRLAERYSRPVIALADSGNSELKGSARSVADFDLHRALTAIAKRQPGLLIRFGGHAAAAGLSVAPDRVENLGEAFVAEVSAHFGDKPAVAAYASDGQLASDEFSLETTLSLERGGPWGVGFLPPQFDGQFELVDARVFAHKHLRMTLRHPGGEKVRAVWFNAKQLQLPKQLHLVYTLEIDRWKDRQSLQLRVLHVEQDRPAADA